MTWAVPLRAEGDIGSSYGVGRTRTSPDRIVSITHAMAMLNTAWYSVLIVIRKTA